MKTFRVLGAVFCVFGCVFALLGVVTSVLPMIENEQFKLIVASFQEPSADPLTNTLNAIMVFFLHSGYFLFFCGISLTVAGGLISSSAHKRQKAINPELPEIKPAPKPSDSSGVPKPAYYPGGLEPTEDLLSEPDGAAPIVGTMKMPIVQMLDDEDEPALLSPETDAQKLMRNDAVLSAQEKFKRPNTPPDYSLYPSNTAPPRPDKGKKPGQEAHTHRPKIVSTMGKKTPQDYQ